MEGDNKVSELVDSLRAEEARLKAEVAAARKNVRQWEKDLARVRSGIRSLTGASKNGAKKAPSRARRRAGPAAVASASHVINAPREYRAQSGAGEPAAESLPLDQTVFEGCL